MNFYTCFFIKFKHDHSVPLALVEICDFYLYDYPLKQITAATSDNQLVTKHDTGTHRVIKPTKMEVHFIP